MQSPHRTADIRGEQHAGVLVEALNIGGGMMNSSLKSRHQRRGAGIADLLHLTVGREVTERQLLRLGHLSSIREAVADELQVGERHVSLKHVAQVAVDMLRQLEDFGQFSEMADVVSRLQDKRVEPVDVPFREKPELNM